MSYYDEFMTLESKVLPPKRPKPLSLRPSPRGSASTNVDLPLPRHRTHCALERLGRPYVRARSQRWWVLTARARPPLSSYCAASTIPAKAASLWTESISATLDVVALRRHMSVIFQDFVQYQLTARENIRLGNVDLGETDPAIEAAARDAGIHETITRLRHGYDTMLGKWFDEGEELSVGEWQKMALARAFVRDAQIIVLDEPTSALDPQAEWDVFQHIKELARGRAVVLISHRFSTVRTADHIHIFDQGRVIESGTHDELVREAAATRDVRGAGPRLQD